MSEKMTGEEMVALCKEHSMFTWARGKDVNPWPITGAEGIYLFGADGERIIDFNSQLMSVNIGHGHPKVRAAMKRQVDELLYVWPGAATEIRARVSKKLAGVLPGHLNTVFYCLGGAEANENAIKADCGEFTAHIRGAFINNGFSIPQPMNADVDGDGADWETPPSVWGWQRADPSIG